MFTEFPSSAGVRRCAHGAWLFIAALSTSCLVDLDDRCGKHQHYDAERGVCTCDADFARFGNECRPCAENEVGSSDGCVCAEGFARATPEAPCQALAGLGQQCVSDADCGDPDYDHCRIDDPSAPGYCTAADCSTSEDCPTDYGCNTRRSPSFCERPPEGLGQPCTSDDDCAGQAAPYCEAVVAKSCVVNDCHPDPDKCHGDWVCCDIALLGQSLCIPPGELEQGNCPAGGVLVPREE